MRASYIAVPLAVAVAAACLIEWGGPVAPPVDRDTGAAMHATRTTDIASSRASRAIADAPDSGALFQYDKHDAVARGAFTSYPVAISEAHALHAIGGTLTVQTPQGEVVRLAYQRHQELPDGNWSWVGKPVDGKAGNEAVLTFGDKAVFGVIPTGHGEPLQITTAHGRTYMVATDATKLAAMSPQTAAQLADDFLVDTSPKAASASTVPSATVVADTAKKMSMKTGAAEATAAVRAENLTGTAPVIDLVLGYTAEYVARYGSTSAANTRLNQLVSIANTAYATSGVDAQLRLVRTVQVNYSETTTNRNALFDLSGLDCNPNTTQGQLPDGTGVTCTTRAVPDELRPLVAARNDTGADLAALVRTFRFTDQGTCGLGWVLGWGQQPITAADYARGYAVVSDSNGGQFPSSNTTCREETLAHELGHNMGLAHDRETAAGANGTLESDEFGRFSYGFGYFADATSGNFTDIMAQRRANVPSLRVFSNPQMTTCGNPASFPCGVANDADSARALRDSMGTIANFASAPTGNIGPMIDLNHDGRADILWSNRTIGQLDWWITVNTGAAIPTASQSVPAQYHVAASGDLDGNGQGDLVWEDGNTVWAWLAGSSSFSVGFIANHPQNGWSIVGAADVNGDNRSDLIWYNRTLGQVDVWLMNGAAWSHGGSFSVPSQYHVVGIGDFNADNRDDLLWTDGATVWIWMAQAGGGFAVGYVADHPANGWDIAGTGDFNGDGRSDLLWSNRVVGQADVWLMNGTTWTPSDSTSVPGQYRVAGVGDMDADGRADVLWDDGATVWGWKRNANATFTASFITNHPANGWAIVH